MDFEGRNWELFAGGFRNQYDAAFNLAGELFTFDADMEWDLGLPWFRPVRTHHVVPGGEYGWRSGTGKWPDYFIDSLPSMTDVGRGSPVGVEFYHHYVYPEKYRGALLLGDWSRGRILAGLLERSGATYKEIQEDLAVGLNPLISRISKLGLMVLFTTLPADETRRGGSTGLLTGDLMGIEKFLSRD